MNDLPETLEITLPGNVKLELRRIPAGSFRMGSRGGFVNEEPTHLVEIPQPFYFGIFPVTQEQYHAIAPLAGLDPDPSHFKDRDDSERRPVECVSWDDAMAVCEKLSGADFFHKALVEKGLDRRKWQAGLPSEAMWEYACRSGTETEYWRGDGKAALAEVWRGDSAEALAEVGWYGEDSGSETYPVGVLPGNEWGLHDMHGNVWEWCADVWDDKAYRTRVDGGFAAEASNTARNPEDDRDRVLRGGAWDDVPWCCRSTCRNGNWPEFPIETRGFRLCVFPGSGDANQSPEEETGAEDKAGAVDLSREAFTAAQRPQNL